MSQRDMLDANAVRIVNSFEDMARWPITAAITRIELRPGRGLVVYYDDAAPPWPDFHLDNDSDAGLVRSTLCAGFCINGEWVMSGFLNYWAHGTHEGHIRTDSGAHPLEFVPDGRNQWQANWAYNSSWAPLNTYVPRAGDLMAVMLAAGGTRQSKTRTWNARTQIVVIPLQMEGAWDFTADVVPEPGPEPEPDPAPEPPVPPSLTPVLIDASQYDVIIRRLDDLQQEFSRARADIKTAGADLVQQLPALLRKALLGR